MNQLRVLLLTALILLPASRVLGQFSPRPKDGLYNYPGVCNDGTIPVSVARAFKDISGFSDQWVIQGWYSVGPGQCNPIGPEQRYLEGGWFGGGSVTLLAFAFTDSTGVWGAARVRDTTGGLFEPSNQLLCVQDGAFRYARGASKGEDPAARECGKGELAGYYRIPVSLGFSGNTYHPIYGSIIRPSGRDNDFLHVSVGPNDRAIPSGTQGSSQTSSNAKPQPPAADSSSVGTQFLQALAKAAAESKQRQQQAEAAAVEAQQRQLREQAAAREAKQKQILAAAAAGNPDAKVPAQMIQREEENNRQRWAGTRQSPAAYNPQWVGQNVAIVGTVSRVEIDTSGFPRWVSIYFKESPDGIFVVCSPYADLFQERIGLNLSALVGKTLEAAGQVESPHCAHKTSKGSIRVVESKQWQVH